MRKSQAKVLWTVLAVNAVMFLVELAAGLLYGSVALTGDSLDMLGDAIAYASSLYVINLSLRAKAKSAILKGSIMLISAIAVLGKAGHQLVADLRPDVVVMSGMSLVALAANAFCLALLTRFRKEDVNMSSVWLCSRNDIIANCSVLVAAGLVAFTGSPLPDVIVGVGLAVLFFRSALQVFADARSELRHA